MNVDRQSFPLSTDSLWTVKFDADDTVWKRREHDDCDVDHRDSKRMPFTHKQPDKRADMELTDDTSETCKIV